MPDNTKLDSSSYMTRAIINEESRACWYARGLECSCKDRGMRLGDTNSGRVNNVIKLIDQCELFKITQKARCCVGNQQNLRLPATHPNDL